MQKTVLISMEVADLQSVIIDCVNACLKHHQVVSANSTDKILGVDEVCEKFGVSRTTIYEWRRTGKVPSHQRGRRVYFKESELLNFRLNDAGNKKEGGRI